MPTRGCRAHYQGREMFGSKPLKWLPSSVKMSCPISNPWTRSCETCFGTTHPQSWYANAAVQTKRSSTMCLLRVCAPSLPHRYAGKYSTSSIHRRIQTDVLRAKPSQRSSCGLQLKRTSVFGPAFVYYASAQSSLATNRTRSRRFGYPISVFNISI